MLLKAVRSGFSFELTQIVISKRTFGAQPSTDAGAQNRISAIVQIP